MSQSMHVTGGMYGLGAVSNQSAVVAQPIASQLMMVEAMEPLIHPYEALDELTERYEELSSLMASHPHSDSDILCSQAEEVMVAAFRFILSIKGAK